MQKLLGFPDVVWSRLKHLSIYLKDDNLACLKTKILAPLILANGAAAQELTVGDDISLNSLGHTALFFNWYQAGLLEGIWSKNPHKSSFSKCSCSSLKSVAQSNTDEKTDSGKELLWCCL